MLRISYPHTAQEIEQNDWQSITAEQADWLLCCIPPARRGAHVFAVGEPLTHTISGDVVHTMVAEYNGAYYSKPHILESFNEQKYLAEIKKQLNVFTVGYCVNCGEGHHLENGLCQNCRPIGPAAQAIIKPEWDKMQDFIAQMGERLQGDK